MLGGRIEFGRVASRIDLLGRRGRCPRPGTRREVGRDLVVDGTSLLTATSRERIGAGQELDGRPSTPAGSRPPARSDHHRDQRSPGSSSTSLSREAPRVVAGGLWASAFRSARTPKRRARPRSHSARSTSSSSRLEEELDATVGARGWTPLHGRRPSRAAARATRSLPPFSSCRPLAGLRAAVVSG